MVLMNSLLGHLFVLEIIYLAAEDGTQFSHCLKRYMGFSKIGQLLRQSIRYIRANIELSSRSKVEPNY